MPRNAAGVYSLPGAVNPVSVDEIITSNWANSTLTDVATAMSDSLDRNGRGGMLAPFRNADGTLPAPGLTFTNEPSTGFARLATGELSTIVQGVAALVARSASVSFLVQPSCPLVPALPVDIPNLLFLTNNYAPLLNPVFDPAGTPKWVGTPTAAEDLTNKQYVDGLAFSTALPSVAAQPVGSSLVISSPGVVQWSTESAQHEALAILTFLGA